MYLLYAYGVSGTLYFRVFEGARFSAKVRHVYCVLKEVTIRSPLLLFFYSMMSFETFLVKFTKYVNNITRIVCNSQVRFC